MVNFRGKLFPADVVAMMDEAAEEVAANRPPVLGQPTIFEERVAMKRKRR
jgi:hypothetical protein